MIRTYTTYDEIRAVLGVSDEDIEDATLELAIYDHYLTMELEEVNIDLPETFATTNALTTPTAVQSRFLQATAMFAAFAVAKQLTSSLPLFAAKQVTDSKAGITRSDNPYKDTIKSIGIEYTRVRNRLIQSLDALGSTTAAPVTRKFFGIVSPSSDPITGT
jgi:hypothetical protein